MPETTLPETTLPRTVRGPVTRHERARGQSHAPEVDHPVRCGWPAGTVFGCEPASWDRTAPSAQWPDAVRVIVTCPDLAVPLTAVAFTFADAEKAVFYRWRRTAACPVTTQAHVWEPRGLANGSGFCAGCGLFAGDVIDLAAVGSLCVVCRTPTWWSHVKSAPGADDDEFIHQARLVCGDCAPPDTDTLLDRLLDHARQQVCLEVVTVRLAPWLRGHVGPEHLAALWEALDAEQADPYDRQPRRDALAVLRDRVADARAHLVDQLLTGAVAGVDVSALVAEPFPGLAGGGDGS